MKHLLSLTALVEAGTGIALVCNPSLVTRLLLDTAVSGAGTPLGRVAGFALVSLGLACWPARSAAASSPAAWRAMLGYNLLVASFLVYLGLRGGWRGPLLWPAGALHAALAILLAGTRYNAARHLNKSGLPG